MVYWGLYPNGRSSSINGRETHKTRRRRNEYYIYTLVVICGVPTVLMVYFSAIHLKYYIAGLLTADLN